MALPFPIIPFAPGVPAIPRLPGSIPAVVDLLVADVLSFLGITLAPQWGLFMNGFPAVIAESVVAFDYRKSYEIPTYPIEDGSFESYNKVERPFDVRLRFTMGGTVADRQAFEATVQEAIASTEFFEAVTPEVVYSSVNPIRMDYVRKASNGVGLLTIDVFCEEVRVGASSSFTSTSSGSTTSTVGSSPTSTQGTVSFRDAPASASIVNPQSPSASPQINAGVVQPALPTVAQQSAVQFSLSQALP